MSARARTGSRQRRRRGQWQFVHGTHDRRIIGMVEQLADGRFLATAANGQQLGITNTFAAAVALVQDEDAGHQKVKPEETKKMTDET
jgi:hypothetical protein